ncbi:unnamed protein product [Miscanthus lutarioriparius]|uniref:Uncharacterized protein n=1 Tax=Miscanthus lutarioriparius TaxID=422564 RepID=A0A811P277_9POAL|nr:unnamed protein product [Miscanthus lutarioriparius]
MDTWVRKRKMGMQMLDLVRSTKHGPMTAPSSCFSGILATDPYADLWKRIEDIPFPPRDKVDIATYLSKPEQVHLRNYLNAASDQSFGTWVTDYLGAKYRVTGVDDGEYGSSM